MPDGVHSTTETTTAISPGEDLARALADPATAWPDVVLREHQLEALDELAGRLQHGATRTWVDAPTGSGKTIMFLALAQALGGSTLALVPRRNLAEQTDAALSRHFTSVSANPEGPDAVGKPGVTVCTYQAALRHQDRMDWDSVTLLICDEAHATLGAQTRKLLDRARNAVVVGFTATGATTTGHVEQVFGPVAATLDRMSAIERGILCPLRSLRVERAVDLSDVARVRGDFDQASLGRALDRARWHRACADVWEEHFQPLKLAGVAYTATVAQAHALAEELTERGVRAAAVSGQTPARELQRVLFDFASGSGSTCSATRTSSPRAGTADARGRGHASGAHHLGARLRPAPGPGHAPGARQGGGVGRVPAHGDPMGAQTSHEVFGLGWYKPLGRVAGPPESGERGKLAKAAALLSGREGDTAKLVNPGRRPRPDRRRSRRRRLARGRSGLLPVNLMEEWVQAASADVTVDELIERITSGVDPLAAGAWWALSGLVARRLEDGADQPLWRAWATALLVQPDLRRALPDDVPRRVLDRLRMTSRERLRALWWHADQSGHWDRLATLEQLGARSDRRRRWVGARRGVGLGAQLGLGRVARARRRTRPGRNQEVARIAAWEAHHLISNGGELALIGVWLRAAGEPPPDPVPPEDPSALRLGRRPACLWSSAPATSLCAASTCGWRGGRRARSAAGRSCAATWTPSTSSPDARRAVRAAVGAMQPKALLSRRAWNALRTRLPRLPEPRSRASANSASAPAEGERDGARAPAPPPPPRLRTDGAVEGATSATPTEGQPQRRDPRPEAATGAPGRAPPPRASAAAAAAGRAAPGPPPMAALPVPRTPPSAPPES